MAQPELAAALRSRPAGRPVAIVAVGIAIIAVVGAAAWWGYSAWRDSARPSALTASGTLEADETLISPQVTGTITSLPVEEGGSVAAGAVVATLDDRVIRRQMEQADPAAYQVLKLQQEQYVLRAPIPGIVTRVPARVGETAMPGEVLLAIANPDRLKLTLYVREADLARVTVGQRLTVTADPFPDRAFDGRVTSINERAEFTPRNVQTQADRLNLVFGVQAIVPNADGALKPGMPVDARFGTGGGA